eukprot:5472930-Pyramimonas_sp.AAC.1
MFGSRLAERARDPAPPSSHRSKAELAPSRNGAGGSAAAGRAAEEGGGCHEGPLQGRELRLLGEGAAGAVHGQLARGPGLTASAGVRVLGLQVRQADLAWHERGLVGQDPED